MVALTHSSASGNHREQKNDHKHYLAQKTHIPRGIFGCHWPNLLHEDKTRHGEIVENWVRYFERCSNTYGIILSRDIAFAASQSLFEDYTLVSYENGVMRADISRVPCSDARADHFYVSAASEIKSFSGCELELYERKADFINYKVTPTESVMTFYA